MIGENGQPETPEWRGESRPNPLAESPQHAVFLATPDAILASAELDGIGDN